jgi:hypothetical protein
MRYGGLVNVGKFYLLGLLIIGIKIILGHKLI